MLGSSWWLFISFFVAKFWEVGGRYCIIQGLPLIHIRQMRMELPQTSILMATRSVRDHHRHHHHPRHPYWRRRDHFSLKFDSLIFKTHFMSLWRVSKMYFSCPFHGCKLSSGGKASFKWSSGGAGLLQMIIEGQAYSCVKSVSEHMFIIWGEAHNQK